MESTKELQEGEAWVDEVVGHRRKRKCMQFRIKWVNDPKPTWEPFENVYVTIEMQIVSPLKALQTVCGCAHRPICRTKPRPIAHQMAS